MRDLGSQLIGMELPALGGLVEERGELALPKSITAACASLATVLSDDGASCVRRGATTSFQVGQDPEVGSAVAAATTTR